MRTEYILYALCALLLDALVCMIWFLQKHLRDDKIIQKKMDGMFQKIQSETARRSALLRQQQEMDGELEESKLDLLTKLDSLIAQSNIRRIFPLLNAEVFLIGSIVIVALGILIGNLAGPSYMIVGLILSVSAVFLSFAGMYMMKNRNYKRIEDGVIDFINLMENYSKTSDDIIDIIGKTYPFLGEPLRSLAQRCYTEGMRTGNVTMALTDFERGINYRMLREIVHNISVCSRYDTNYKAVIQNSRDQLMDYLAGKEKRRTIINTGRTEFLIILILAGFLFYFITSLVDNLDVAGILLHTMAGNVLLIIFTGVILLAVYMLFIKENGRD